MERIRYFRTAATFVAVACLVLTACEKRVTPGDATATAIFSSAATQESQIFYDNLKQPGVKECRRGIDEHGLTKWTKCIFEWSPATATPTPKK